ncbi:MAG: anti-sigma factor family protein [Streptosporangiaceae bacterium]
MSHLGERLTALIDGELDHDARDRVLAHLALCDECRVEADSQRALKRALSGLGGPPPSDALVGKLRSLAEPGPPLPPPTRPLPGRSRGPRSVVFRQARHPGHQGHRPLRYAVAGLFSLAIVAFCAAFVAGGGGAGPTTVDVGPAVNRYAVEHAATVGEVPLTDPAAGAAFTTVSTTSTTTAATP